MKPSTRLVELAIREVRSMPTKEEGEREREAGIIRVNKVKYNLAGSGCSKAGKLDGTGTCRGILAVGKEAGFLRSPEEQPGTEEDQFKQCVTQLTPKSSVTHFPLRGRSVHRQRRSPKTPGFPFPGYSHALHKLPNVLHKCRLCAVRVFSISSRRAHTQYLPEHSGILYSRQANG